MKSFKDIKEYAKYDNYFVSEDGKIFFTDSSGCLVEKSTVVNKNGYVTVTIKKDCKTSYIRVHRIVAAAFVPRGRDDQTHVDHINENKLDNRASNLQWCNLWENVDNYGKRNGRLYAAKKYRERKRKLKTYEMELRKKDEELKRQEVKIKYLEELLIKKHKALDTAIEEKLEVLNRNYDGYRDTKGMVFNSKEDMVAHTGKKVFVNGVEHPSARSAAVFITAEELKLGKDRSLGTISKEIRRYLQGRRPSWKMYGRYEIK